MPGRNPRLSPRLDHRTGEHDAADVASLERGDRGGHGEIGLAGAGGAQAERDSAALDRLDVATLAGRLGANGAAPVGKQRRAAKIGHLRTLLPQAGGKPLDILGRHALARRRHLEQVLEQCNEQLDFTGGARKRDAVALHGHVAGAGALDRTQVRIGRTEHAGKLHADGNRENHRGLAHPVHPACRQEAEQGRA